MAEIIPPANPLVPLAAPPYRSGDRGREERTPSWQHRHRSFQEELIGRRAAVSYARDEAGTHLRAARLDDEGVMSAVVVDIESTPAGPRTTVTTVRETTARHAAAFPLLQPGRLVNIVV